MILTLAVSTAALAFGVLMPLRWGLPGFLNAAVTLFLAQFVLHSALGFEGSSIEESLLLFNGSWSAYLGFNAQITYRAFALPLLLLSAPLVWRLSKARKVWQRAACRAEVRSH
ncbi:hypothetical protein So717_16710 [Roseobacter cerasinus]|uniref:Uncharacterized protein n=1 Tax=Roseobacter cerasinus TaxID=2602289 RepID=A0A640VN83_9RHOB|nr:hypothetical protein [Roseobacter cerasinus]GFE49918.1 hypothetical protein So717_16710 [Roseobacter cerasinus]